MRLGFWGKSVAAAGGLGLVILAASATPQKPLFLVSQHVTTIREISILQGDPLRPKFRSCQTTQEDRVMPKTGFLLPIGPSPLNGYQATEHGTAKTLDEIALYFTFVFERNYDTTLTAAYQQADTNYDKQVDPAECEQLKTRIEKELAVFYKHLEKFYKARQPPKRREIIA